MLLRLFTSRLEGDTLVHIKSSLVFFVVGALCNIAAGDYSLRSPDHRCDIRLDYKNPNGPAAATLILRSGYSRDNDDSLQGNYETAVLDLELVGRKLPTGEVCLFLVTTSTLSEEAESAQTWASQYFLRRASVYSLDPNTKEWLVQSGLAERGDSSHVVQHVIPPYAEAGKYQVADGRTNQRVSVRSANYLGAFKSGRYSGQSFLQSGHTSFANQDASDYNVVRHIVEWSIELKDGELNIPDQSYVTTVAQKPVVRFTNQVRLLVPPWNGSVVASSNGSKEVKYHHVSLMWLDAVVSRCPNGTCKLYRYDLLATLKTETEKDPQLGLENEIGRLKKKLSSGRSIGR